MREIVLDTETTGLDPEEGHRIVEIACVELANHVPTGRVFHRYVNPQRPMSVEAEMIHGLTDTFLAPYPPFSEMVEELLAFIGDAPLVIHNAEFDLRFLNAELKRLDRLSIASAFTDTLTLARRRFPGAQANLDALCRRFAIDLSAREKHGARLDAELLAAVYLELIGGRQPGLALAAIDAAEIRREIMPRIVRPARPHSPTDEELAAHLAFLSKLKAPLWLAATAAQPG